MSDEPDKEELVEVIRELEPYIRHRKDCSFNSPSTNPRSDYCNCGVNDAINKADQVLKDMS